ncbi:Alpha carbonic anhydrase 4 [Linum perenne]
MEDQQDEFNYDEGSERGPSKWGTLKSEWKDCAEGKSQTPIELYQRVKHAPNLGHLNRSYKSASATIGSSGHAVEVEWEGDAGGIKIGKTSYKLIQCHWHTPTEHSVYGKRFEMELHMVHKTSNGTIAVVAFMYMFGESDPFLTKVNPNQILFHLLITGFLPESLCQEYNLANPPPDRNRADDHQDEFNYEEGSERGPSKWGTLKPEWKVCAKGKSQSPIELYHTVKHAPNLGHLNRSYKSASATIGSNGHVVELDWEGDAGGIKIRKTSYKLIQCHWHTPTEHSVYGKRFDMELHMVHKTSHGTIAVVAFMYMFGESDPFLTKLLPHIISLGSGKKSLGKVNPLEVGFSSNEHYYRYEGSLTTPPCTEGVTWTIFQQVRSVSPLQVQALKNAVHKGFQMNARPSQLLNGRTVHLYN